MSNLRFDLDEAKQELEELNKQLQEKCEDLSLTVDYYKDMKTKGTASVSVYNKKYVVKNDSLLLCLNHEKNCISSLIIEPTDFTGTIEIVSRTDDRFQRRKFNKLLRAVIIIIGGFIKDDDEPISLIVSKAENPISAHLMINTFKAMPSAMLDGPRLPEVFRSRDKDVSLKAIKTYMDKPEGAEKYKNQIKTVLHLIMPNKIQNAKDVFENLLNSEFFKSADENKQCIRTSGGKKTKRTKPPRKRNQSRKSRKN